MLHSKLEISKEVKPEKNKIAAINKVARLNSRETYKTDEQQEFV